MRLVYITLACCCLATTSLVYRQDPTGLWHNDSPVPGRRLMVGEFWLPPATHWFEEPVLIAFARLCEPPDIVVFGSSRINYVTSALFNPDLHLQSFRLGGASTEDMIGLWHILRTRQVRPKYTLLFLDPWVLNK